MKHKIATILLFPALVWIYCISNLFGYLDDDDASFLGVISYMWRKGI